MVTSLCSCLRVRKRVITVVRTSDVTHVSSMLSRKTTESLSQENANCVNTRNSKIVLLVSHSVSSLTQLGCACNYGHN